MIYKKGMVVQRIVQELYITEVCNMNFFKISPFLLSPITPILCYPRTIESYNKSG